jgi:hypothetical protein|tara:strand:- start:975 stop:1097 length:123 start_codon:yes stop_codon:yes gene_type:complete
MPGHKMMKKAKGMRKGGKVKKAKKVMKKTKYAKKGGKKKR